LLCQSATNKKFQRTSSNVTNLAAATHDNDTDSIVDQADAVVQAGGPNHSFLSPQDLQGNILENDEEVDDGNDHLGAEYNATMYNGRVNTPAVLQARLSVCSSSAHVAASIAPDLSTLSRNGLIAAANEALRVQRSLEHEVAA
jgi:hypothetical protein